MLSLRYFACALAVVLSFVLPSVIEADEESLPEQTGLRPDAPTYAIRGEYWVGARYFETDSETPIEITIWYPALNIDDLEEEITYPFVFKFEVPDGLDAVVSGRALLDAPVDLSDGPYPLVVLSPGFGMGRNAYSWLAEHLASYGFVVVAVEHHETFDDTWSDFWRATITRPQEVLTVLEYVEALTDTEGPLNGLIDMDLIAVTGHSYGGYTSLAAANGKFDMNGFVERCESARDASDPNAWLCDILEPHINDMADLAGIDTSVEVLWPAWGDSRVDAIVPLAGDSYLFDQAGLAEITIPVMTIGGTLDSSTPYEWGALPTYQYVSSENKVLVTIENAEHMIFVDKCDRLPWAMDIGLFFLCSDPVWDMNRVHDLVNHLMTAFLLDVLKGDKEAHTALLPENVTFPGLTYETTMK